MIARGANVLIRKASVFTICLSFCFFQAVVFVSNGCAQPSANSPQAGAPIDIQADEQDFADDQVIAKGNVKVTSKDSVIVGPMVTVFRDAAGQAQRAIFVGHPSIIQTDSKMNADTLTFEIVNSKVIAQGHAHSEVVTNGDTDTEITPKKKDKTAATQSFKWPQQGDGDTTKDVTANEDQGNEDSKSSIASSQSSTASKPAASGSSKKKLEGSAQAEKIITDSDNQEYDKQSGHFDANGHVHVIHGDISVFADKLQLVYGTDSKPETAFFTGHVSAFQDSNNTQSDLMTYHLATKRLQATGNVRSKVVQQKTQDSKNGKKTNATEKGVASRNRVVGNNSLASPGVANAASAGTTASATAKHTDDDDTILIVSDAQDYSKESSKMTADGNVKVYYQDTVGVGPKAVLLKNDQGKAEKVIFVGRSQITQTGKRWIADKITLTMANKKVLAEGNTRALIIQNQSDGKSGSVGIASKPDHPAAVSTTKIEATR